MSSITRTSTVVVRTYVPARRMIIAGAVVAVALFAFYFTYELGRYDAGYDRMAVSQQRVELDVARERAEKENRQLRTQLAELDTVRIGRAREQAEVSRSIGELQAQVARLSQELAFYRGVVAEGPTALGIKIQQLRLTAGDAPGRFHVHLALVRTGRPDDSASGSLVFSVDGTTDQGPATLDHAALTASRQRELAFTFRYLGNFDQQIALPSAFHPERLTVEVRSSRKGVSPLSQTFLWNVEGS